MALVRIKDNLYERVQAHVDGVQIRSAQQFVDIAVEKALAEAAK